MSTSSWAPMYWAEYSLDTVHLSFCEHGAYLKVLAIYYQAGKAPEANFDRLARAVHAGSEQERQALRVVLKQFFKIQGGRYVNKRAEVEIRERKVRSEKARESAEERWKRKRDA